MDPFQLPQTPACKAATEYASGAYEPFLLNHVLRSFVFADTLGSSTAAVYDRELLYLACLLHDLGLTRSAPLTTRFEVEGADAAVTFLARHGLDDAAREIIWDAIALHTTFVIPQRKRPEIALCQTGTAIDVGFAPQTLVGPEIIATATAAYPRLGFKAALVDAFCGLVRRSPRRPRCRPSSRAWASASSRSSARRTSAT